MLIPEGFEAGALRRIGCEIRIKVFARQAFNGRVVREVHVVAEVTNGGQFFRGKVRRIDFLFVAARIPQSQNDLLLGLIVQAVNGLVSAGCLILVHTFQADELLNSLPERKEGRRHFRKRQHRRRKEVQHRPDDRLLGLTVDLLLQVIRHRRLGGNSRRWSRANCWAARDRRWAGRYVWYRLRGPRRGRGSSSSSSSSRGRSSLRGCLCLAKLVGGDVAVAAFVVYALIEAPVGTLLGRFGQDADGDVGVRSLPDCLAFHRGCLFGGAGFGA